MRVCLFSEPCQCFDLPEFDRRVIFLRTRPGECIPDADLYVWNYSAKSKVDAAILARPDRQHLVLINSDELNRIPSIRNLACILLKPITPFTLKAFLDLAVKNHDLRALPKKGETARFDAADFSKYIQDVNLVLQQFDRERTNFLACALHDLRTPLTAIHGYCGLLAEGNLGSLSPAQQELIERMQYSTRRLMRLTSGAFGVAVEGRAAEIQRYSEGDLAEVIRRALHDIDPLVSEKNLTVQVQLQPPNAGMFFEPEQIHQVFLNLLENSCKFTPRHGSIEIQGYPYVAGTHYAANERSISKSQRLLSGYRVDVVDSGPGIPAELADKIFEPYSSFLRSPDRAAGGLGLAICRSILGAHQGAIWATPNSAGGHFSFVLPVRNAKGAVNSAWTETAEELEEAAS